ncbi:MAG: hypothetical protein LBV60_15075 [Streptomyces sp.]|jgi:hypothetical protein|nr:hypothetical protein [Streptomyces sp.]
MAPYGIDYAIVSLSCTIGPILALPTTAFRGGIVERRAVDVVDEQHGQAEHQPGGCEPVRGDPGRSSSRAVFASGPARAARALASSMFVLPRDVCGRLRRTGPLGA